MRHESNTRCSLGSPVALMAALYAVPAHAHLEATGLGPVYDGVLHFLSSPEDLVPAIALALLAGLRGAEYGRRMVFSLPLAWLLGSLAGLGVTTALAIDPIWSAASFLLLGGLVLTDAKFSLRMLTVLSVLLGFSHGLINGSSVGWSGPGIIALLGVASTVFICCVMVAAFVTQLRAHWARIAVRVAGSWIAAIGMLMAGWSLLAG